MVRRCRVNRRLSDRCILAILAWLKAARPGKVVSGKLSVKLSGDVSLAVTFYEHYDGWPKSGCLIACSELVFVASATPLAHCAKVVGWLSELSDTPAWVTTHVLAIIQRGRVSLFSLFSLFTLYFLRLVFSLLLFYLLPPLFCYPSSLFFSPNTCLFSF